jgi:hypothetical protein
VNAKKHKKIKRFVCFNLKFDKKIKRIKNKKYGHKSMREKIYLSMY